MFYFAQLLMNLKKSVRTRWLKNKSARSLVLGGQNGQSTVEYFLLFAAVAAIGLLIVSSFYQKAQQNAEIFFNETAKSIMGEPVQELELPTESQDIEVPPAYGGDECVCSCSSDSDCPNGLVCRATGYPNPFDGGGCERHCTTPECIPTGGRVFMHEDCEAKCCSKTCYRDNCPMNMPCSYICN